jgi:CheY-like chemotaxis protein
MSANIHLGKGSADAPGATGGQVRRLVLHPPRVPLPGTGLHQPRILIADDYDDAAESLSLLLQIIGARTEIALDGKRALHIATRWRPDICVLDLQMPGLDGREVARQIRAQSWAERPLLIALTGWTGQRECSSALAAGFDHYVTKPVEPVWLIQLIEAYCLAG